jgi:transcriptional regulator with XRE-family HTH domain
VTTTADRLRQFIEDPAHPERSGTWLARILGVSQAAASHWMHGKYPPAEVHRAALAKLTGIPAVAWMTRAERKRAARIAREVEKAVEPLSPATSTEAA